MHFRTLFLFGALLTLYLAIGGYPSHAQPQVHGSDSVIEKADIILGEGEQRLLRVPGLLKYSIGSPRIRAIPLERNFAKLSQRQDTLLIKGVTAGLSDLWIWKQGGQSEHRTIRVEKNTQTRTLSWDRALAGLQEVEVLYSGKGAILRGRISSLAEAARVSAMVRNYPNVLFNETTLAPELLTQTKAQLEHWLMATPAGKNLRIEQLGEELWVRGSVDSPSVKQALEKQVHALFPTAQTEIDTFPDHSPTIYFRVFLLELKKIKFHSLGLSWPAQTGSIFKVATGSSQGLFQMDLTLQHLEGSGHAKVLSNPELVVRAPGEAELFAGGEIPIQMQNRYYANTTWKNYGLTLRLKVTQAIGDRVRLDIFTEVSHLDSTLGQDKLPGIQSNRMKTQVDARFGVPLLLSGLLQEGTRRDARGLPFLRKIPVLGSLFGSEDYLNERSELVAILYPHSSPPPTALPRSQLNPRGTPPFPRHWMDPGEERVLRESRDYPWNALN